MLPPFYIQKLTHSALYIPNPRHSAVWIPKLRQSALLIPGLRHSPLLIPRVKPSAFYIRKLRHSACCLALREPILALSAGYQAPLPCHPHPENQYIQSKLAQIIPLQYNYWMHKLLVVLLLLAHFSYSQTVVAKSDATNTISGVPATPLPYNYPTTFLPGAQAIWNSQGNLSPPGTKLVFTKLFYLSCAGPLTLSIAAYGSYSVFWDGPNILNGANTNTLLTVNPKNQCGRHNLTIVVSKTGASFSGLIYSLSQDQSNCFKCNSNGQWNQNTCACECIQGNICTCPKVPNSETYKIWSGYPTCACTCPKKSIKPLITAPLTLANTVVSPSLTAASSKISQELAFANFGLLCPLNQYYSEWTCSCRCNIQYCPPRFYFNDDPKLYGGCKCVEIIY